MKKIISLGAAAAVLSLTAVAASAAIAPQMTPASPVAGDTVTVEIVANGMTQEATTFTVNASDNLTLTANEAISGGLFNADTNKFAWAGTSVPADGTVLLTLTYTVDAASDEEVSVALVADAGFTDISADTVAAVVVDGEDTNVSDEVSSDDVSSEEVPSEDVPSEDVSSEEGDAGLTGTEDTDSADATGTADSGNTGDNGNASGDKGNPGTGVALAVVPAVLAGAAIVVAKKRK